MLQSFGYWHLRLGGSHEDISHGCAGRPGVHPPSDALSNQVVEGDVVQPCLAPNAMTSIGTPRIKKQRRRGIVERRQQNLSCFADQHRIVLGMGVAIADQDVEGHSL